MLSAELVITELRRIAEFSNTVPFSEAQGALLDWRQRACSSFGPEQVSVSLALYHAGDPNAIASNDSSALRQLCDRYLSILRHVHDRVGQGVKSALHVAATQRLRVALVLKGGGVKGLALAGALETLETYYSFTSFGGTSAGAIAAVLLATGYDAAGLRRILEAQDFRSFLDRPRVRLWNLFTKRWLNSGTPIQHWIADLVDAKLPRQADARMSDLPKRAVVYATNERDGTVEFDSRGKDKDVPVHFAARCSMAIPYFFAPCQHAGEEVFDGGLLNNFPLEQFLRHHDGPYLALYLSSGRAPLANHRPRALKLFSILLGRDERATADRHSSYVVTVDPSPIRTTQFRLSDKEKQFLLAAGRLGALRHLKRVNTSLVGDDELGTVQQAVNVLRRDIVRTNRGRSTLKLVACISSFLLILAAAKGGSSFWPLSNATDLVRSIGLVGGALLPIEAPAEETIPSSQDASAQEPQQPATIESGDAQPESEPRPPTVSQGAAADDTISATERPEPQPPDPSLPCKFIFVQRPDLTYMRFARGGPMTASPTIAFDNFATSFPVGTYGSSMVIYLKNYDHGSYKMEFAVSGNPDSFLWHGSVTLGEAAMYTPVYSNKPHRNFMNLVDDINALEDNIDLKPLSLNEQKRILWENQIELRPCSNLGPGTDWEFFPKP